MEEKKEERLEFRGGSFFAVLPLILFVVVCIMLFVVFKVFEMEGLCMGGILVLIIGSLFAELGLLLEGSCQRNDIGDDEHAGADPAGSRHLC